MKIEGPAGMLGVIIGVIIGVIMGTPPTPGVLRLGAPPAKGIAPTKGGKGVVGTREGVSSIMIAVSTGSATPVSTVMVPGNVSISMMCIR